MRKIREVLRLKFECGLSNRQIANSISVALMLLWHEYKAQNPHGYQ